MTSSRRIRASRSSAYLQGLTIAAFTAITGSLLIYQLLFYKPDLLPGLVVILVIACIVVALLPRVFHGGWIDFGDRGLTIHSAWSKSRTFRYSEVVGISIIALPAPLLTQPATVQLQLRNGRHVTLQEFHSSRLTRRGALDDLHFRHIVNELSDEIAARIGQG